MLIDSFGRTLSYLRVSITDRCNLRCVYCMPPHGVEWKAHENILSFEEIIRIVKIMAGLGVRRIKVTGGEPLLRRGTPSFLKELKTISGIENLTLTTNGLLLGAYLDEAETAGALPDGINISIDALDSERYKNITRRDMEPKNILSSLDRLLEPQPSLKGEGSPLDKKITVKINCVPVRSVNEEEIVPLAALARNKNIAVRFIELMPLGSASALRPVLTEETAVQIEKAFGALKPFSNVSGNGPAVYYSLPDFAGKIGFISPLSCGFCEKCNRLRLTPEGFLKLCLSHDSGLDLRELLRAGADDAEIARAIVEIVKKKPRFHTFSQIYGEVNHHPDGMSKIGG